MKEEIWKTIEEYPNYDVSTFGNVRNNKTNKMLKPALNSSGYYRYTLIHNFKRTTVSAHRIVAKHKLLLLEKENQELR